MLPCLVFHLNAFEAIKLLQSLLAGLEYRQVIPPIPSHICTLYGHY